MSKRPSEEDIALRIHNLISASQDQLFEQFDDLHKREIHDNDVIGVLRSSGYAELAASYAEWADIVIAEDDNTTTSPVVPDPGDAPSYATLKVKDNINGGAGVPDPGNAPSYEALKQEAHFIETGCDSSLHPDDCLGASK